MQRETKQHSVVPVPSSTQQVETDALIQRWRIIICSTLLICLALTLPITLVCSWPARGTLEHLKRHGDCSSDDDDARVKTRMDFSYRRVGGSAVHQCRTTEATCANLAVGEEYAMIVNLLDSSVCRRQAHTYLALNLGIAAMASGLLTLCVGNCLRSLWFGAPMYVGPWQVYPNSDD